MLIDYRRLLYVWWSIPRQIPTIPQIVTAIDTGVLTIKSSQTASIFIPALKVQ